MKNLLEHNFISHYGLTASVVVNVVSTTDVDFDLKDDAVIVYPSGAGIAKYSNSNGKQINIVNYECFINSLPTTFQTGREKCDLIVYSSDLSHFILNELTDTQPKYISDFTQTDGTPRVGKRNKTISQLKQTLQDISNVTDIDSFIKRHDIKHCCFFNAQTHAPIGIIAIVAFGRLSSIAPNGYKISNPDIESFGFELWEFSGTQTYLLEISVKSFAEKLSKLSTKEVKELAEIIQSEHIKRKET